MFKDAAPLRAKTKPLRKLAFGDASVGAWVLLDSHRNSYEIYARYNNVLIDVTVSDTACGGVDPSDLGTSDIASMAEDIVRSAASSLHKS